MIYRRFGLLNLTAICQKTALSHLSLPPYGPINLQDLTLCIGRSNLFGFTTDVNLPRCAQRIQWFNLGLGASGTMGAEIAS